jgi:hypothetical protein
MVMHDFIKHFIREGRGVWVCVEPGTLELPSGRIQVTAGSCFIRGTIVMGIEIAELLEDQFQKDRFLQKDRLL